MYAEQRLAEIRMLLYIQSMLIEQSPFNIGALL